MATKQPIQVLFCGMHHQKSKFSLTYNTFSVGGCWGQPILLFWKLVDETKSLILLPLRAVYFRSFLLRQPVGSNQIKLVQISSDSFLDTYSIGWKKKLSQIRINWSTQAPTPALPCPILFLVIFDCWETWLKACISWY